VARELAGTPVTALRRARWVALSFVPSSLMLAVTSYLSTDIAAVPLLWIVPLALYLLTFALAFGRHSAAVPGVAGGHSPSCSLAVRSRRYAPLAPILILHVNGVTVMALGAMRNWQGQARPSRLTILPGRSAGCSADCSIRSRPAVQ
jgi:hypothetical protein